ncbi:MAG: GyrI-like domain-containing protein [Chitinophagaceae bacterium]
MNPRIELLPPKKLVGLQSRMCMADDKTVMLWQTLMPRRAEIGARASNDYISMQVYDKEQDLSAFNRHTVFQKWAAVEVEDFENVPAGMETYNLEGGLYAVFIHKGSPAAFPQTWKTIFMDWMPASDYELDAREHFEVLGEKYKRDSGDSEEEVWIPIKKKEA